MAPTPYVSEHLHVTNEIPPEAEVFFSEQFQKLFEGTQEVGRGYNGRVVEYVTKEGDSEPQGNKIVFKVLMRSPIGHQNDLLSEASYLADLYAIADKYHGPEIGVPRPHYCASLTNARVIAMDKVPGASVEKILTEGIPLPDGYDINLLEEKLLSFVEHMHREGFHHNDLRTGNIMVDLEREDNEKPLGYVIDTGNAKHITQKQIAGDNLDNTLDHVMVRQVIRSLRVYQEEQIKKASQ
jgi:tRNA A-37 threonylcarbamoyl transferase component Bud32